ncbi:MAG: septum formation initiator family protein [Lachnospiraceae bacterium]|nr:septum formation initiator family protein [Lachnospiraceae bacterium]
MGYITHRRQKVAYKKNKQNKLSIFLVSLTVSLIIVVTAVRGMDLKKKIAVLDEKEASLKAQIEKEEARAEEIEQYGIYTQTKAYYEEVAKDKLGLVYEGEILFKKE